METFGSVILGALHFLQIPFTLYGFTLSLWEIYLWTGFAGIILYIIYSIWRG